MSMQYKGDVDIVEADPSAHRAKMRARAREARGQGTANADVVMSLSEQGGRTHGTIKTDVQLCGRVASMGRGIIQDVSAKIVDQFSENLATMLSEPSGARRPATAPARPPRRAETTAAVGLDAQPRSPPRRRGAGPAATPAAAEAGRRRRAVGAGPRGRGRRRAAQGPAHAGRARWPSSALLAFLLAAPGERGRDAAAGARLT